jgi:hypothetical protein
MPKPVKKPALKKSTTRTRPSSDPNRRAGQLVAEHTARMQQGKWAEPQTETLPEPTFEEQFRARMAELGRKGGKVSGAKRMEMPAKKRREIARKAAAARWKDRS